MANLPSMPLDNLTDLLVFIRVADACSFTLAAERLGISRSAAGKCVNRLEERLATRLLQRTTRSVSLTEDGAVFYEYAQRILSQAEEAETAPNTRRQTPRGRLRLDLPVSLGRLHILPILREFWRSGRRWTPTSASPMSTAIWCATASTWLSASAAATTAGWCGGCSRRIA